MARIAIYDKSGNLKLNSHGEQVHGKMKYVGQTMSIPYLEFTIASTYPIAWNVGDYVDYGDGVTGVYDTRFVLFTIPQPQKVAGGGLYGGGFVYSAVQFHDLGNILANAPFTDMQVENDNLIHFSTRSNLSTFENVGGILARLQACTDAYRKSLAFTDPLSRVKFYFRLCTSDSSAAHITVAPDTTLGGENAQEYEALIAEAREVTIDGTVLDGLNNIQNIWPAIGWDVSCNLCVWSYGYDQGGRIIYAEDAITGLRYDYIYDSPQSTVPSRVEDEWGNSLNVIPIAIGIVTIGAVNFVSNAGSSVQFSRDSGLNNIKKYVTNQNDFITRLVAYGSEQNLSQRYYNQKPICNKDSVDIPNLMIPIEEWGTAYDSDQGQTLPSAPLAFLQNDTIVAKYGLRVKRVYFDGSNNLDKVYPTIKGMHVKDLRDYVQAGGTVDYPSSSAWMDYDPLDEVSVVYPNPDDLSEHQFDSGVTGENGKISILKSIYDATKSGRQTVTAYDPNPLTRAILQSSYPIWGETGDEYKNVIANVDLSNFVFAFTTNFYLVSAKIDFYILARTFDDPNNPREIYHKQYDAQITQVGSSYKAELTNPGIIETGVFTVADDEVVFVEPRIIINRQSGSSGTISWNTIGSVVIEFQRDPIKNFVIYIPPFGYDIKDIVSVDGDVRIAVNSGSCAGREFVVKKTILSQGDGGWGLLLERQYDESLSTYFPNSDYPIQAFDKFVILGIAMPEVYVFAAEKRLLAKAQAYYDQNSKLRYLYDLEIDSKWMRQGEVTLRPGMYLKIADTDLIGSNPEYVLVDTVTITENESNIPTFKVTLREKLYLPE